MSQTTNAADLGLDFDPYTAFFETHMEELEELAAVLETSIGLEDCAATLRGVRDRVRAWCDMPHTEWERWSDEILATRKRLEAAAQAGQTDLFPEDAR